MSTTTNRLKGKAEEIGGAVQKNVGRVIGNEDMEAEGAAHQLKGKAVAEAAKAGERLRGAVQSAVGTVKENVGEAIGNDRLRAKGAVDKAAGKIRKDLNRE